MTLSQILVNLYRRLNYADAPEASVTARLTMFVNQRYRELVSMPGMDRLRDGFGTITSVAGQAEYTLADGIQRLRGARDRDNDQVLSMMALSTWRSVCPDPVNLTGTPTSFVPIGIRATRLRPNGAAVWAVSTSAADTTQTITIHASYKHGTVGTPEGRVQSTTHTLNGTTRVALAFSNELDDIFDISISSGTVGQVSLWDDAVAGNRLVIIPSSANVQVSRLYAFALHPTPSAARTYDLDYEHALVDLTNTWDEPRLPDEFHDLLVWGALTDEYIHRDDERLDRTEARYNKRLGEMKAFLYNHRSALRRTPPSEFAPLGTGATAGWYPRQNP